MSKTTFYFVIFVLVCTDIVQSKYQKKLIEKQQAKSEIKIQASFSKFKVLTRYTLRTISSAANSSEPLFLRYYLQTLGKYGL